MALETVDAQALQERQSFFLNRILAEEPELHVQLVRVAALQRLTQIDRLTIDLDGDYGPVTFQIDEVIRKPNGDFAVKGSPQGQNGYLYLTAHAGNITGILQLFEDAASFSVQPIGRGVHAITEVHFDPDMVGDEPAPDKGQQDLSGAAISSAPTQPSLDSSAPVVDILCAYTDDANSAANDIEGVCEGAVDITNDILSNTPVSTNVTVNLVHMMEVNYNESGDGVEDLDRLVDPTDNYMDNVHTVRNQMGADVVVLLLNDMDRYGRAAAIAATSSEAFAVSEWGAAIGRYTFPHEITHLVGGRHNDRPGNPNPWAQGYVYAAGGWQTVMGVTIASRSPYFSNPSNSALGVPHGTSNNDVGRVWENRGGTVAAFKTATPSVDPPSNLTITNAGNTNQNPDLAWSASSTSGVTYEVQRCASYYQSCSWQVIGTTSSTSYTDFGLMIETQSNADDEYRYQIKATKSGYNSAYSNTVAIWGIAPAKRGDVTEPEPMPTAFELKAAYPNPFNPAVTIPFEVPSESQVSITVYDVMGRPITTLADAAYEAGRHAVRLEAEGLASGLYLVRAHMTDRDGTVHRFSQRLTLIK